MQKIIIASGLVIVEDGKVLLNRHGEDNFWKFCGGGVENFDDDLVGAAAREAREEMGIEIEISNPEPFFAHTKKETAEGSVDVILVHFLARRVGEVKPGADIREWKWIPLAELEKENIAPNILPALRHFGFV